MLVSLEAAFQFVVFRWSSTHKF